MLVLNNLAVTPATAFTSPSTVSQADSDHIVINIQVVPTGNYLVRVQINGAESLLTTDASGTFTGPKVSMP